MQRMRDACILVVDDVQVNRKIIASQLAARGYKNVLHAKDGREALEITHLKRPDLVILDLMMPEVDGFAYCDAIRRDADFNNMPIIVQTALDEIEHKMNAFKRGASDYLCKPVDGGELEARVRVHLLNRFLINDLSKHNERMMQEMQAAQAMQNRLMPSETHIKMCERMFNMNIATHFETSSLLGGDCWGMRPICDDKLAVFMYDFSGHGITAAMNIFRMHTIMRDFNHIAADPGAFLTNINRHLHPLLERNEFATMFYGIIDTASNCLLYATAATTPPILYSRMQQDSMMLANRGFPLGVVSHASYETKYVPMLPGDMLLLYSDGLIESIDTKGNFLNEQLVQEHTRQVMDNNPEHPGGAVVNAVYRLLKKHNNVPPRDDLTISVYARNMD